MRSAVFLGLAVVDVIHGVSSVPRENEKAVAVRQEIFCGGPAANAAITCAFLGNKVSLVCGVGIHPVASIICADLARHHVSIHDLTPGSNEMPSLSSVLVTEGNGARTIVSGHATRQQVPGTAFDPNVLNGAGVLMLDGHQAECAIRAAVAAKERSIPVVLDGGSWKNTSAELLAHIDVAICSENFHSPGTLTADEVIADLRARGIACVAITRGANSILWATRDASGEINVPRYAAVDTTGAGDVFHGAFCHQLLRGAAFPDALTFAAKVASVSCQYFGTREWMKAWSNGEC